MVLSAEEARLRRQQHQTRRRPRVLCVSTEQLALPEQGGLLQRLRRFLRGLFRAFQVVAVLSPLAITFPFMYFTRRAIPWLPPRCVGLGA